MIRIDEYRKRYYESVTKPKRQQKAEERRKNHYNLFYCQIHDLCKERGMTHRDLANACGVTEATMSRWMSLDRRMDIISFHNVCTVFGVNMEELYEVYIQARKGKIAR